ncbi:hypothetical protein D9M68_362410 [compost metagenome]
MNKPHHLLSHLLGLCLSLLLTGCAAKSLQSEYEDSWRLGFFVPNYMEAWIETADVADIDERLFRRAGSGLPAIQTPPNNRGNPYGWPSNPGEGAGKYVLGANLPRLIFVRWQSLVEPQTYKAFIEIPESTRELMRKKEKAFCAADGKWIMDRRRFLSIGLAPGGIAKVWLMAPCIDPVEVTRVVGTVDPRGPYEGKSEGHYYFLSDESKAYVEQFGVPYGSW